MSDLSVDSNSLGEKIPVSDKYIFKKHILSGSIGDVYFATDLSNVPVIIKVIRKVKGRTEYKIKSDVLIPKMISHPNITKIIDFVENSVHAFIVYPYVENSICLRKMRRSKFNLRDKLNLKYVISMMYQISNAIEFIHQKNIIHRDIKPENIVVNNDIAILVDFDLSFVLDNPFFPPRKGIVGTPNYMAPELFKKSNNINYKLTDIYSFGVTLYFVFNKKKLPYNAKTISDVEYSIRNEQPIKSNSGISIIDRLIMKAIDKNPNRRPSIKKITEKLKNTMEILNFI